LYIPYPYAAGNHQYFNAKFIQKATCLLTDAPSKVDKKQLLELHLKLNI